MPHVGALRIVATVEPSNTCADVRGPSLDRMWLPSKRRLSLPRGERPILLAAAERRAEEEGRAVVEPVTPAISMVPGASSRTRRRWMGHGRDHSAFTRREPVPFPAGNAHRELLPRPRRPSGCRGGHRESATDEPLCRPRCRGSSCAGNGDCSNPRWIQQSNLPDRPFDPSPRRS